jgi:hypothetical protein
MAHWYLRWMSALVASFLLPACASAPPGTLLNPRCVNAVWRPAPGYYPPSVCQDSSCPAICEARRQEISMSPDALNRDNHRWNWSRPCHRLAGPEPGRLARRARIHLSLRSIRHDHMPLRGGTLPASRTRAAYCRKLGFLNCAPMHWPGRRSGVDRSG